MTRYEEIAELYDLAAKIWPGITLEILGFGGLHQPAESVEVWKTTTFGRQSLFSIRIADAVKVTGRMFKALANGVVEPCGTSSGEPPSSPSQ